MGMVGQGLRGLDTLGRCFAISAKGNNFFDVFFIATKALSKRGLLYKEIE